MIDQELVDSIQKTLDEDEGVCAPYINVDEIQQLLNNYKQLIKDNAELHKKLSAERVFVVNDDK